MRPVFRGEYGRIRGAFSKQPYRSMVESLVAMTGNRHESLLQYYEALDREINQQISMARPTSRSMIVWPTDDAALQPQIVDRRRRDSLRLRGMPV